MPAAAEHGNACPVSHRAASAFGPQTALVFPRRKSAVLQHGRTEDGRPELQLFHGEHEISFDEPNFFPFAETLARQTRFKAAEALGWGAGYAWDQVGPLLESLLEAGVLVRAEQAEPDEMAMGVRASPLPPARCQRPRTWSECETIMAELTGRPLELGWLELVVPVFRVAHIALDAEGRQVGEGNVFPPALRLDVPTKWRTCLYEGTRHQPDRPMNVEALRAMRAHWSQMMAVLRRVRAAYLGRCPSAGERLTLGEVERLAVCVLAVPSYQLMRTRGAVANGALHPVLSSLFRVTDGLRMVVHQMLFVPLGEPTRNPDERLSAAEIHAYAERNYSFHSEHGVCAGPPAMVAEFLAVLVDGEAPAAESLDVLPPEVEAALADIDAAIDYAFLGLQAHAAAFSVWPAMARAYEVVAEALATTPHVALADRFAGHIERLRTSTYLGAESLRVHREAVYEEMFAACGRAVREPGPPAALAEARRIRRAHFARDAEVVLATLSARVDDVEAREMLTAAILDFAAAASAAIQLGRDAQDRINRLLGRARPTHTFDSIDLDLHNRLNDLQPRRVPYLFDELGEALGLSLIVTADNLLRGPAPNSAALPSGSRATLHAPQQAGEFQ